MVTFLYSNVLPVMYKLGHWELFGPIVLLITDVQSEVLFYFLINSLSDRLFGGGRPLKGFARSLISCRFLHKVRDKLGSSITYDFLRESCIFEHSFPQAFLMLYSLLLGCSVLFLRIYLLPPVFCHILLRLVKVLQGLD